MKLFKIITVHKTLNDLYLMMVKENIVFVYTFREDYMYLAIHNLNISVPDDDLWEAMCTAQHRYLDFREEQEVLKRYENNIKNIVIINYTPAE